MLRRISRCRRGAASLMFAAAAIPTIGLTALGAEAGTWYLIHRHAQNAADAAAYAGAFALTVPGQSADVEGKAFAKQGGFCNTGAGCAAPMANATQSVVITSNGNTVTATVTQSQPPLLASLFLTGNVQIVATAVAQIQSPTSPCALALKGLTMGGNASFTGGNCALMSDTTFNPPPPGQQPFSGSGWYVGATNGGCTGNVNACNFSGASYDYNLPPMNPPTAYTNLVADSTNGTIPTEPKSPANLSCANNSTCNYSPSAAWQGNLNIKSGGVGQLANGTYLFDSLTINGTLQLAPGATAVNIIIGSGGLSIKGTVNLQAATVNANYADLGGVLFFDMEGTAASPATLTLNGSSTSVYGGAMYFPNANVTWSGNSASASNCTEIIANSLTFTGTTSLATSGCAAATVPVSQFVVMTQ